MSPIESAEVLVVGAALRSVGDDVSAGFETLAVAMSSAAWSGRTFGAVRNHQRWWVVIIDGGGQCLDGETSVHLINDDDELVGGRWEDLRLDEALSFDRDAAFAGDLWSQWFDDELFPPFHLDADAWVGSVENSDDDDALKFEIDHDGAGAPFRGSERSLWGREPAEIRAGTWLSLGGEYNGADLSSDANGCLWGSMAEFGTVFLGRPTAEDPSPADEISTVLDTLYGGGEMDITSMQSDFLDPLEMSGHVGTVRWVSPNFDPDEISVDCVGFSGTVTELFDLLGIAAPELEASEDDEP